MANRSMTTVLVETKMDYPGTTARPIKVHTNVNLGKKYPYNSTKRGYQVTPFGTIPKARETEA